MSGDLTGSTLAGYRVTARLGAGGMGEVWRATDTRLEREVAIKVLPAAFTSDPERLARFEREAKLLAQLHHPHIASIFGLAEEGGVRALVMELVEGPTLAERLEAGALSLTEALVVARQIAEALEEAHEKGIVHRDLKPQNVKAPRDGKVKVLDFGLAKAMAPAGEGDGSGSQLAKSPTLTLGATVQGVILGTAAYMAPEQAAGGTADRRVDVWSFGVVLYEMLVGRRLFEGETVSHVLAGVLKDEPDFARLPPDVPPRVLRLLRRCLRKKPRERLQSIGDARVVLDEVLAGGADEPAASLAVATPPAPRRRAPLALAVVAALAAGALLGSWFGRGRGAVPAAPSTLSELSLPIGSSMPFFGPDVALAPDGARLAMVLVEEGTQVRELWVRNLATGDQRRIAGTAGARLPFWSLDGAAVGYYSDDDKQLKRVDLEGGRPVPLAKAAEACGASWGRERIVFCESYGQPLRSISASGSEPADATLPEKGEMHFLPAFLADGRRFVYTSASEQSDELRTVLAPVGESAPRELLRAESKAVIADGRLYFLRGRTLLSRPFDEAAGELGEAEPEIVAEGVDSSRSGEFTAAPGLAVFAPHRGSNGSRLAIYDRRGERLDQVDSETFLDDLTLADDGRTVAVMKAGADDATIDVWTLDLGRKVLSRTTFGESDDDPVFSPDGRTLAFAHEGDLYRRAANGAGEPLRVLEKRADIVVQDWTADGWIVYSDLEDESEELFAVRAEGGEPRRLTSTPFRETLAQVSPDGRWLAYVSNESGEAQVYLTGWPELSGKWRVSTASAAMPRWGRGGRELYFLGQDSRLMRASIAGEPGEPAIGLAEELFPVRFQGNFFARTARWAASADGERFYVLESIPEQRETRPVLMLVTRP